MSKTEGNAEYTDVCKVTIAKMAKKILPWLIVVVVSASLASIAITAGEEFGGCEGCHPGRY